MQTDTLRGGWGSSGRVGPSNTEHRPASKELQKAQPNTGITDAGFVAKYCCLALYCVNMLKRDNVTIPEHGASMTNIWKARDMLQIHTVIYFTIT